MKRPPKARLDTIGAMLRTLPVDKRAETIVEMFRIISREWALMVLEHVKAKPEPKPKRRARR